VNADTLVLGSAGVFLMLCLTMFWWGTRESSTGHRHAVLVFAWLCAALAATLVVFWLFPESRADGSLLGITLGGAGAFVILVWTAALRATERAGRRDALERQLRDRNREIAGLRKDLVASRTANRPSVLAGTATYRFTAARTDRELILVTGDIRNVRGVHVWVNPENTALHMARTDERSVSGIIRYEGARHDEAGHITADLVADDVARVAGRNPVAPGTVVITTAGELSRWGVRRIAHVAAVHGEPGAGYRQIRDVARCVTTVLETIEGTRAGEPLTSVLLPMLGAGQGGGDVDETADVLLAAATAHLAAAPGGQLTAIYLLAYTDAELAAYRRGVDRLLASGSLTAGTRADLPGRPRSARGAGRPTR
jgi:O-acetyl-ADP-ribose deacetylase (regulator of RNase III)